MVARNSIVAEVARRLDDRRLVWVGIRTDDLEPLADIPQLSASFCLIGSTAHRGGIETTTYEDLTGERMDPETWDIDERLREPETVQFRHALLKSLAGRSAVLPYRPSHFLSAVLFARQSNCLGLGQFASQQSSFEHKPWVETAVAQMGLPHIPWTYVADEEQLNARELSSRGSIVLRPSRTSGGQGFRHIDSPDDLAAAWPHVDEEFVSVAPYLRGGIPINIGAVVWRDGVTVHHPSVQLIGVASCVTREFGYCGNDFGLVRDLPVSVFDQIETATIRIGEWLRTHGYLGAYGVDYLVHNGVPLFTEINPRFQGSTKASCRLDVEAGAPCIMVEHLAAWLGVPCPPTSRALRDLVSETRDLANVVVHWTGDETQHVDATRLDEAVRRVIPSVRADVITPAHVQNARGSAVLRFSLNRRVTTTGFDLAQDLEAAIVAWTANMHQGESQREGASR